MAMEISSWNDSWNYHSWWRWQKGPKGNYTVLKFVQMGNLRQTEDVKKSSCWGYRSSQRWATITERTWENREWINRSPIILLAPSIQIKLPVHLHHECLFGCLLDFFGCCFCKYFCVCVCFCVRVRVLSFVNWLFISLEIGFFYVVMTVLNLPLCLYLLPEMMGLWCEPSLPRFFTLWTILKSIPWVSEN